VAISGFKKTVSADFELTRCFSTGSTPGPCRLIWPTDAGLFEASTRATCAPNVAAVVILANSGLTVGGGQWSTSASSVPLAVVGVPMSTASTVNPLAYRLLAHELGHALGLLDEYTTSVPNAPADPPGDRNVWAPGTPPWPPGSAPPWSDLLTSGCVPTRMAPCCGDTVGHPCTACSGVNADVVACPFVPSACQEPCPTCAVPATCPNVKDPTALCPAVDPCDTHAGAWEGAHYTTQGKYRAHWGCRMQSFDTGVQFCEACKAYLWTHHLCGTGQCDDLSFALASTCP
jgi:hypothetical protein